MVDTTKLGLPLISAAQAQKHVTMNENLYALDTLVQMSVLDKDLTAPPVSPTEGDAYIVGASATGAWAGHDGKVAAYTTGMWFFHVPRAGWLSWVDDEDTYYSYDGSAWVEFEGGHALLTGADFTGDVTVSIGGNLKSKTNQYGFGIGGASADVSNALSFNGSGALFNNAGGNIQLKLNKAAASDTASFLFQNAFSGRAEIGLVGNDNFSFKVSADGSNFNEGIVIFTNGAVSFPNSKLGEITTTIFASGSGSYTPPSQCKAIKVIAVGGGGGGAGGETTSSTTYTGCPGGGAGGTCIKIINNPSGTYTYNIGTGGAGGSSPSPQTTDGVATGGTGGQTTFNGSGVSLSANGGGGGIHRTETSGTKEYAGGLGGTATGGDYNIKGGNGGGVLVINGDFMQGLGYGGASLFGQGGTYNNGNGSNGQGFGSGGAGAGMIPGFVLNRNGGNGSNGIIIIEEYY